jgi:hypothetical protein
MGEGRCTTQQSTAQNYCNGQDQEKRRALDDIDPRQIRLCTAEGPTRAAGESVTAPRARALRRQR